MQQLRKLIAIQVIAVAINIILNLVLIPRYSGLGAIWATIASYTFTCGLYAFFIIRASIAKGVES